MKIRSKLQTWYLITVFFIVIAVIALSVSISLQVDNLFIDYRNSVDRIGLEQVQETFNLLDATAQDILLKVQSHPATTLLSLAPSTEDVSPVFIRSFQRMQDMVLPFIYSINVIHVPTGRLITTRQGWSQVSGDLVSDFESAYPDLPQLRPLPLETVVSPEKGKELTFAYLLRDTLSPDEGLSRGVILLVDPTWFLNAISHTDDERTGTRFLLYHPRLGILGEQAGNPAMTALSEILKFLIAENPVSGDFRDTVNSVNHVIDYQVLGGSDLYLLRLRDETILLREILILRTKIAGIAVVFLIVSIIGGLLVNKQVYRPFYSIVTEIRESLGGRLTIPEDDLDLLNALYGTLRDEYSESGEDRIINSCLRSLSQEDPENPNDIIGILHKRGITLSEKNPGCLCLISIDEMDEEFNIQGSDTLSSYPAMKYQFRTGTAEALAELGLGSAAIFLRRGVMLLLIFPTGNGRSPDEETVPALHKMLCEFMETSVSIARSELLSDLCDLRQKYLTLSAAMRNRFLLGSGICLTGESGKTAPEKKERESIKQQRMRIITGFSDRMVLPEEFNYYLETLQKWAVKDAQDEINVFSLSLTRALSDRDTDFQPQDLFRNLINQPTLNDFRSIVEGYAKEQEGNYHHTESRHSALVDLARDMIEKSYSNPGLNLTSIAEELKMSPTYFGIIFKKTVGTPFSDYLTMVRIQEAARLLNMTRDSVQEIMVSVGIPSESTFYRRFREIFKLTPHQYRQQSILNRSDKG